MFDLPDAKRVRREDLRDRHSSSRSPSPVERITATYAANTLRDIFSSIETYTPPDLKESRPAVDLEHIQDEEEEQEFEFRLFHSAALPARKGSTDQKPGDGGKIANRPVDGVHMSPKEHNEAADAGIQRFRIRLRSPTPAARDEKGEFVIPFRGWEYYFSNPEWIKRKSAVKQGEGQRFELDTPGRERFIDAAVSGKSIIEHSKNGPWPGCHLPWRVIHLKTIAPSRKKDKGLSDPAQAANATLINMSSAVEKVPKSKKKPGKRRRIAIRRRLATAKIAEEADREKRARRNREKKIKRRQKEKEKKAALREAAGGQEKTKDGDSAEVDTSD
ncbi:uncharacterized protein PADG_03609 [Paracoccidioides brasiliensis Pb18]|uniref:Uncharacterized protein n=1 Tax=Paracoccidioides brasiliensis (strain Pb18) TaxID=502780 RepID=C1G8M3_PARBD|nr:uncharacterized protein PADG_03609 [Paracoccidioides brasiliensis Pb18]EEH47525.2 hypothetical protein PADG_03609 [Paracoccidioides brasiliensis Pb18]